MYTVEHCQYIDTGERGGGWFWYQWGEVGYGVLEWYVVSGGIDVSCGGYGKMVAVVVTMTEYYRTYFDKRGSARVETTAVLWL